MLSQLRQSRVVSGESDDADFKVSYLEQLLEDGILVAGSHGMPDAGCQLLILSFDTSVSRPERLAWLQQELPHTSVYRTAGLYGYDVVVCGQIPEEWVETHLAGSPSDFPAYCYYYDLRRLFRYKGYALDENLPKTPVDPTDFSVSTDLVRFISDTRDSPLDRQWLFGGHPLGVYTFFILIRSEIDIKRTEEWLSSLGSRYPELVPYIHDAFVAEAPRQNDYRVQRKDIRVIEPLKALYRAEYLLRLQLMSVEDGQFVAGSPFAQADRIRELIALGKEERVVVEAEILFLESARESHEQYVRVGGQTEGDVLAAMDESSLLQSGSVFISYSHRDKHWLDRLRRHLKPSMRNDDSLTVWDYSHNEAGEPWRERLDDVLQSAAVAVLLVSPDFLESDFIHKFELGPILERRRHGTLEVVWIPVSHCDWAQTELADIEAVVDPRTPLNSSETDAEIDKTMVDIVKQIRLAHERAQNAAEVEEQ